MLQGPPIINLRQHIPKRDIHRIKVTKPNNNKIDNSCVLFNLSFLTVPQQFTTLPAHLHNHTTFRSLKAFGEKLYAAV